MLVLGGIGGWFFWRRRRRRLAAAKAAEALKSFPVMYHGKGPASPRENRAGTRRETAVGLENRFGNPVAIVRIDANEPHTRPPAPVDERPPGSNSDGSIAISSIGIYGHESSDVAPPPVPPLSGLRPLPLGKDPSGSTIVRGASTLNPLQAEEWRARRANIQHGLSRGAIEDSPQWPNAPVASGNPMEDPPTAIVRHGSDHLPEHVHHSPGISEPHRSFGRTALKKVKSVIVHAFGHSHSKHSASALKRSRKTSEEKEAVPAPLHVLSQHALNVCKEVRETEAAYISDLQTVVEVYVRPATEKHILTLEDTQAIFSNLEELCRCATVLLELMDRGGDQASVLAHAFIQVTPFFKLYALYCRNYERALTTLAHCRRHVAGLNDFLTTQAALPQCRGLSLESYLIKPVQRLTKYPLFWKDLLKQVPHTHPDRASLEKADELVRTVSMAVNQTLTDEVSRLKTVQLLQEFGADWMVVIAPHRKLVLEFTGVVYVGVRSFSAFGYLLTDLLLLCQPGRSSRKNPWLLAPLGNVIVNQELALESVALSVGAETVPAAVQFGVQPPADVPRSRLLNLRIRPDEEYWLELPDEAAAYQLADRMSALGEASERAFSSTGSSRTTAVEELMERLRDARAKKDKRANNAGRASRSSYRNSTSRKSTACRNSMAAPSTFTSPGRSTGSTNQSAGPSLRETDVSSVPSDRATGSQRRTNMSSDPSLRSEEHGRST